jgi:hypothetical protein
MNAYGLYMESRLLLHPNRRSQNRSQCRRWYWRHLNEHINNHSCPQKKKIYRLYTKSAPLRGRQSKGIIGDRWRGIIILTSSSTPTSTTTTTSTTLHSRCCRQGSQLLCQSRRQVLIDLAIIMDRELVANDDYAEDYPGHVHRVRPIERQSGLVGGYWEEFQPYQKKSQH